MSVFSTFELAKRLGLVTAKKRDSLTPIDLQFIKFEIKCGRIFVYTTFLVDSLIQKFNI